MGSDKNEILKVLLNYLEQEHMDKKKSPFDTSGFEMENVKDIPRYVRCLELKCVKKSVKTCRNVSKHVETGQNVSKHVETYQNVSKLVRSHQIHHFFLFLGK